MAATNVIPIDHLNKPKAPRAKKVPAFKLPKTLAQCADLLYTTRQNRLDLEKEVAELKNQENKLREHLIENLPKSQASGVSGQVANAKIDTKDVPKVEDWEALHKYVKRTGDFELLQRRLSDTAIKERWDNGKKVPGVVPFKVVVVSCTKV